MKKVGLMLVYNEENSQQYKDVWSIHGELTFADNNPYFYGDHIFRIDTRKEPNHSFLKKANVKTLPTLLVLEMDEGTLDRKVVDKLEGKDVNYDLIKDSIETQIILIKAGGTSLPILTVTDKDLKNKAVKFAGFIMPKWGKYLSITFLSIIGLLLLYAGIKHFSTK